MGAALIHANRVTDGRMDRHDEANRHCSRLCESVLQMKVQKLQLGFSLETNYIWVIRGHYRQGNMLQDAIQSNGRWH
jgi:hypothetical protein